ncbi:MAG TPA: indolepyruvate oxidoreductase subunit beta [Clostridia bacterium]|nr:indolepyruvate oxidoreductase subunit beta [Clostridia bacterium]
MERNYIVAGIGGQGSIKISHMIAEAAIRAHGDKYRARVGETFGAAQRGGAVASHVRIGEDVYSPLLGKGRADLVLALEPLEGLRVGVPYLSASGIAIINTVKQDPVDVKIGGELRYPEVDDILAALRAIGTRVIAFDGSALAAEAGSAKVLSAVMLGAAFASGLFPFDEETILAVLKENVPESSVESNLTAFRLGKEAFLAAA